MGLPGAGPICSRLGAGPFLTARFSGPIFLDFWSLFWSPSVSILEHFLGYSRQHRFFMISGSFWDRFWGPCQVQKFSVLLRTSFKNH